jgi:hypothetical protein
MKTIKKMTFALLALVALSSCTKEGDGTNNELAPGTALKADAMVKVGDLPQPILDYVAENYPDLTIVKSEVEDNGHFEVKLSDRTELIFDADGVFLGVDDDNGDHDNYGDEYLDIATLLPAILEYIDTNYPDAIIKEASMENNGQIEVTLRDKTVLIFDANGEFLGVGVDENDQDGDGEYEWGDGDHHDDGENIDPAELPEPALAYLEETYPDLTIIHAELEHEGKFEVTLSNGMEVYFDADGNFISAEEKEDSDD